MSIWVNITKNTASYTNQTKNVATFTNQVKTQEPNGILLESGFHLLLESGYELLRELECLNTWSNATKN